MSTRQVLGVVGAAIGGYFFGPQGAQWGWAIGSAIGGAIDPEIIKGPSVGDVAAQTSQEGTPRPIVFALSQPIAGNIIASGEPRIVRKRKRQGKGGPKVETETVYRTYAIGVCEGPITRFVRIWRNGTLIYDRESNAMETGPTVRFFGQEVVWASGNIKFGENGRLFLGTWEQTPSPDLETIFGVGTTPAHRGTAYMVMADEDLTDLRGAIPQYQFQVERCEGVFVTSRPYPVEATEALSMAGQPKDSYHPTLRDELSMSATLLAGTLRAQLLSYDNYPAEALDFAATLLSGTLRDVLTAYNNYPAEAIDLAATFTAGTIDEALIQYDRYPAEAIDLNATLLSGTLT